MEVQDSPTREEGRPPKGRGRKSQQPIMPMPTLPPEAEEPFRQLWDRLMGDDLDVRCRTMLWLKEHGHPHVMHRIFYETQVALRSRSQAVRDKASTLIYFLGPWLVGFPPTPPTLDELVVRLRHPDPEVRQKAAEALGDMGKAAEPAVGLLQQLLHDPDGTVQFRVAVAIGQITGKTPEKPPAETELRDLLTIVLSE